MSHGTGGVILQGGCEEHPNGHSTAAIGMLGSRKPWRSRFGLYYNRPITRWKTCTCGTRFDFKDTVVPKPKAEVRPDVVQAIRRLKDAKHMFPWEVEWLPKSRSSSAT